MLSNINHSNQIKDFGKIFFPQKILLNKRESKNNNLFNQNSFSKIENYEQVQNISSFYAKNFNIQYLNGINNKKHKIKCEFERLPEFDLNPFLTYAKKENQKITKVVNLKEVENSIEENNFYWLDSPCSLNN